MEKTILYTLPTAADATAHTVLRLTVGVVTALGIARYRRLMRESTVWIDETFGEVADSEDERTPEAREANDATYRRCYMLATLKSVEVGTCSPEDDAPNEWKAGELPTEWQSIDGFLNGVPGKLFSAWDTAAIDCNPDTFFIDLSDEKKRRPGSVTVI